MPPYFVIASAVDEALRSMKFQPAPSEMLELCCQANNKLSNAIGTVERLDEIRHEAALIADATLGQELTAPPYVHQVLPRLWKPPPARSSSSVTLLMTKGFDGWEGSLKGMGAGPSSQLGRAVHANLLTGCGIKTALAPLRFHRPIPHAHN